MIITIMESKNEFAKKYFRTVMIQVRYSSRITILRGNHESRQITQVNILRGSLPLSLAYKHNLPQIVLFPAGLMILCAEILQKTKRTFLNSSSNLINQKLYFAQNILQKCWSCQGHVKKNFFLNVFFYLTFVILTNVTL